MRSGIEDRGGRCKRVHLAKSILNPSAHGAVVGDATARSWAYAAAAPQAWGGWERARDAAVASPTPDRSAAAAMQRARANLARGAVVRHHCTHVARATIGRVARRPRELGAVIDVYQTTIGHGVKARLRTVCYVTAPMDIAAPVRGGWQAGGS